MLGADSTATLDISNDIRPPARLSATGERCWYITARIGSVLVDMLIDTGAYTSLLNRTVFERLCCGEQSLRKTDTKLYTASGKLLNISGEVDVKLKIGNCEYPRTLVVADMGEMEGVLGLDFLEHTKAVFDISAGCLILPTCKLQLHREDSDEIVSVCVREDSCLPPFSELIISGYLSSNEVDVCQLTGSWVVESTSCPDESGLVVARSVVSVGEVPVRIMNMNGEPVVLKKGTRVASAEAADEICSAELDKKVCTLTDSIGKRTRSVLPEHLDCLVQGASKKLTESELDVLTSLLSEYSDIFATPGGPLGRTDLIRHKIDTGDAMPVRLPPRRLPPAQREIANQEIDKMLEQGVVEPSDSPWAAPIVLVRKKDGTTRFCVDYRKLNNVTRKDAFPIPHIGDTLDTLGGSQWFCTMDLASGYWQIGMDDKDKSKTAFTTHRGLYQFNVMPFGLSCAPATFSRVMELVLRGLQWDRCLVYLDDIIVFGRTFGQTIDNLEKVFSRLRTANLKLKAKKCHMFQEEVAFLGHIVSADGVRCDPAKVSAVRNWEVPKTVSELRSFLGLASYYRRFIEGFSSIAGPLHELLNKNKVFQWSEECQNAFGILKDKLTSAPVLAYPRGGGNFILDTDCSGFGMGAVLSEIQDGEEKVIAYASHALNKSQRKYCTTYRELLAAVTFIKHFRTYLGTHKFILRTDHASLKWLLNFKDAENMLARWLSVLTAYDFEIVHRRGSKHGNSDALSRKPRHCKCKTCPDCTSDSKTHCAPVQKKRKGRAQKQKLPPQRAEVEPDTDLETSEDDDQLSNWIKQYSPEELRKQQAEDVAIRRIIELKTNGRPSWSDIAAEGHELKTLWVQWSCLVVNGGLLYRRWVPPGPNHQPIMQLVLPTGLRMVIFKELHSKRIAGHLGVAKTVAQVKRRFYWPCFKADVERWCRQCRVCQQKKPGKGPGRAKLKQEPVGVPLERVAVDILGPLPATDRANEYIMVISDYYSKYSEAYAIPNHRAQTVADVIVTEFIARFGVMQQLHSDQGREFESDLFQEICRLLDIDKTRTVPYNPKSDGLVERFNRTLQQMLSMFVNEHRDDWDDHLPYVMMAYRSSVQESTGCTPNMLFFGREITVPVDVMFGRPKEEQQPGCPIEYVEWVRRATGEAFEFARENLGKSAVRQERLYNRRSDIRRYNIGDWVWRWYPPKAKEKLGKGWTGPYLILDKLTDLTYKIQASETQTPLVVHVDHMKKYESDVYPENWVLRQEVEHIEAPGDNVDSEIEGSDPEIEYGSASREPAIDNTVSQREGASTSDPIATRRSKRTIKPRDILDL